MRQPTYLLGEKRKEQNLKRNINPQTQKHSGERLLRNIMPMIGRHVMKNFWHSLNLQIMCSTDRKEVQWMKVSLRKGRLGNGPMWRVETSSIEKWKSTFWYIWPISFIFQNIMSLFRVTHHGVLFMLLRQGGWWQLTADCTVSWIYEPIVVLI